MCLPFGSVIFVQLVIFEISDKSASKSASKSSDNMLSAWTMAYFLIGSFCFHKHISIQLSWFLLYNPFLWVLLTLSAKHKFAPTVKCFHCSSLNLNLCMCFCCCPQRTCVTLIHLHITDSNNNGLVMLRIVHFPFYRLQL